MKLKKKRKKKKKQCKKLFKLAFYIQQDLYPQAII